MREEPDSRALELVHDIERLARRAVLIGHIRGALFGAIVGFALCYLLE